MDKDAHAGFGGAAKLFVEYDDQPESLHATLDGFNIPRYVPVETGSVGLTLQGRMMKLGEQLKNAQDAASTAIMASESAKAEPTDQMQLARQLLARSFSFLQAFENTADLRQQIKLFLDKRA